MILRPTDLDVSPEQLLRSSKIMCLYPGSLLEIATRTHPGILWETVNWHKLFAGSFKLLCTQIFFHHCLIHSQLEWKKGRGEVSPIFFFFAFPVVLKLLEVARLMVSLQ